VRSMTGILFALRVISPGWILVGGLVSRARGTAMPFLNRPVCALDFAQVDARFGTLGLEDVMVILLSE
jgi:hypothetical protein